VAPTTVPGRECRPGWRYGPRKMSLPCGPRQVPGITQFRAVFPFADMDLDEVIGVLWRTDVALVATFKALATAPKLHWQGVVPCSLSEESVMRVLVGQACAGRDLRSLDSGVPAGLDAMVRRPIQTLFVDTGLPTASNTVRTQTRIGPIQCASAAIDWLVAAMVLTTMVPGLSVDVVHAPGEFPARLEMVIRVLWQSVRPTVASTELRPPGIRVVGPDAYAEPSKRWCRGRVVIDPEFTDPPVARLVIVERSHHLGASEFEALMRKLQYNDGTAIVCLYTQDVSAAATQIAESLKAEENQVSFIATLKWGTSRDLQQSLTRFRARPGKELVTAKKGEEDGHEEEGEEVTSETCVLGVVNRAQCSGKRSRVHILVRPAEGGGVDAEDNEVGEERIRGKGRVSLRRRQRCAGTQSSAGTGDGSCPSSVPVGSTVTESDAVATLLRCGDGHDGVVAGNITPSPMDDANNDDDVWSGSCLVACPVIPSSPLRFCWRRSGSPVVDQAQLLVSQPCSPSAPTPVSITALQVASPRVDTVVLM
jgi:hypothetical protein